MPSPTFTNEYHPDGKADRAKVREESGFRCIRCGHPYVTGLKRPDRGEWSDCDERCTHGGTVRMSDKGGSGEWHLYTASRPIWEVIHKDRDVQARWRILTVHHFDGDKANDRWFNKLALCQVCHLSFQTRVNPEIPWLFEHSDWLKPYVAAFYARKYLAKDLTREEVMADLDNLLALERKA